MEPLSVAVHAVSNIGSLRVNQSIAIFGCGPVGLLCMAVAKALGASRIIAVDIVPSRLEFAKKYVATDTFLPLKPEDGENVVPYTQRNAAEMKKLLGIEDIGSKAVDLVLDASGAEASLNTGILVLKMGGTFIAVSTFVVSFHAFLIFFDHSGGNGQSEHVC
jgi:D-xylulose reductase